MEKLHRETRSKVEWETKKWKLEREPWLITDGETEGGSGWE